MTDKEVLFFEEAKKVSEQIDKNFKHVDTKLTKNQNMLTKKKADENSAKK
jgi:hypothetical protein